MVALTDFHGSPTPVSSVGTLDLDVPPARDGKGAKPSLAPLPSASSAAHGPHCLLCALGNLLWREILDVGRDRPHVTERVLHRAESVTPEHVFNLLCDLRARLDGLLHHGVDVLDVEEHAGSRAGQLAWRP